MLEPATIIRQSKGESRVIDESTRISGKIGKSAELLGDRLKSVRLAGIPLSAALAVAGAGYSKRAEAQTLPSGTIEPNSVKFQTWRKGKKFLKDSPLNSLLDCPRQVCRAQVSNGVLNLLFPANLIVLANPDKNG